MFCRAKDQSPGPTGNRSQSYKVVLSHWGLLFRKPSGYIWRQGLSYMDELPQVALLSIESDILELQNGIVVWLEAEVL